MPAGTPGRRHVSQKSLRVVAAPFGGRFALGALTTDIATSPGEEELAGRTVRELAPDASPVVVVHPGTTWGTKRMAPEFWAGAGGVLPALCPRRVSAFRVPDGTRNAPYGPKHRFVQAPMPCTACLRKRCDRDAECRESIWSEDVAKGRAALLGGGQSA